MKRVITLFLCLLLLILGCVPGFAADAPSIDSSRAGSLTIYKYDMTAAAQHGLTDTVYLSTGQPDEDAAAAFAPYAIPGAAFTILRVGAIDTYASGAPASQIFQVIYGIDNPDLISALGLTSGDVVVSKAGVPYYTSDTVIKALSDKLTANNTSTKNRLESIIASSSQSQALPLTDSTGKTNAENLPLGLYLAVETKVPQNVTYTVDPFLVSVPTTDRTTLDHWFYDVTVNPKNLNGKPNLEKQVEDAAHGLNYSAAQKGYADVATAHDGDTLNFRILSTVPRIHSTATYLTQYDFVDTLSQSMTYNRNDVKICWYRDFSAAEADYTPATASASCSNGTNADAVWNYGSEFFTVAYGTQDEGTTMTVRLTKAGLEEVNKPGSTSDQEGKYSGWTMVVYYNASLHSDQTVTYGEGGNPNDISLTWSRTTDGFHDTIRDRAMVYAYGIDLTKVLSEGGTAFQDVRFLLRNQSNQTGAFYLTAQKADSGVYYITGTTADKEEAASFSPNAQGRLLIYGLEEDSYVLTEIATASGYTLLKDPIEIAVNTTYVPGDQWGTLTASATVNGDSVDMEPVGESAHGLVPLTVLNTHGFTLPKTGGSGTMLTTLCGILLLAGVAGYVLYAKGKRRA